uniref:Putative secreted peptide n=1 Tax=Anopheles braziliensis TaxID=58242 RepID=A0A2M3ZNR4_9DIPT
MVEAVKRSVSLVVAAAAAAAVVAAGAAVVTVFGASQRSVASGASYSLVRLIPCRHLLRYHRYILCRNYSDYSRR